MIKLRPIIRYLAALACLGAAFLLLARSGLPRRIDLGQGAIKPGAGLAIGSPAPQFELLNTSEEKIALGSRRGHSHRHQLLGDLVRALPPGNARAGQQLQSQRPDSIRVLAINMGESADLVAAWQREIGLSYDLLLDPTRAAATLYKVRGLPTTFLLDGGHVIRNVYYGPVARARLEADLRRLARRV